MTPQDNPRPGKTGTGQSEVLYECACGATFVSPPPRRTQARCRKCSHLFAVRPLLQLHSHRPRHHRNRARRGRPRRNARRIGQSLLVRSRLELRLLRFRRQSDSFLVIAFVHFLLAFLSFCPFLLMRGYFLLLAQLAVAGWLCTFYLSTILHAAPVKTTCQHMQFGLARPARVGRSVRGTAAAALLPGSSFAASMPSQPIPFRRHFHRSRIGAVLIWPAIVLTTAIGRGWGAFGRTSSYASPGESNRYAAVCATTAVAAMLAGPVDLFNSAPRRRS